MALASVSLIVCGGHAIGPEQEALRQGCQIVVGTPGRILDHLARRSLRPNAVRYLVLDEADEMLDRGFAPDVERIIAATATERQTSLFSATTPEWVQKVAARYLKNPLVIQMGLDVTDGPAIEHQVCEVWHDDKFSVLRTLLDQETEGATLVFGRTKHGVRNLGERLVHLGYAVDVLQGNLTQLQRDRVTRRFREGATPILVATNVAARGLDVLHIGRVINYELPRPTSSSRIVSAVPAAWDVRGVRSRCLVRRTCRSGTRSRGASGGSSRVSRHRGIAHPVILARKGSLLLSPHGLNDLQCLFQLFNPHTSGREIVAEGPVLCLVPPRADTE